MTRDDRSLKNVASFAMVVSCLLLAHQVAGKAARDALFLSQFNSSYLPLIVMVGATVSIAGGLLNSRVLQVLTPARMLPGTLLISGVLHLAEWSFRSYPIAPPWSLRYTFT